MPLRRRDVAGAERSIEGASKEQSMRTILLLLFIIVYFTIGFLWMGLIGLMKLFKAEKVAGKMAFLYIHFGCKVGLFISGTKVDARGVENIQKDRAALYVLNHRSIFDIIITYAYMKDRTGFIAKKELSKIPIFSWWVRLGNGLFLDRDDIRQGMKTILTGIEYLKDGVSMCIFPEGTRNKDNEDLTSLMEFHAGSFKLSEKSGAPVVPVAVYNTAQCLEDHFPWIKSTHVKITFGTPIEMDGLSKEEMRFLSKSVHEVMEGMLQVYKEEEQQP